jgi:hypothetical protein
MPAEALIFTAASNSDSLVKLRGQFQVEQLNMSTDSAILFCYGFT